MASQILLSCLKFIVAGFSLFLLSKIKDASKTKSFCLSQGNVLMLLVSGVYVGISMLLLLPFSEHELHLANIEHEFMVNYLIATLSFGAAMLVDKIAGYDYEEQRDSIIEEEEGDQEDESKKSSVSHKKQLKNEISIELQDIEKHQTKTDLEEKLIHGKNETCQESNGHFEYHDKNMFSANYHDITNYILIYFYVVFIGISIGSSNSYLELVIQAISGLTVLIILTIRISQQLADSCSPLAALSAFKFISNQKFFLEILSYLFVAGIIIGTVLIWVPKHTFRSSVAAFNAGTLLYVGTMKLLQKYYDHSGNKFLFFFSFFIGFAAISLAIFYKILDYQETTPIPSDASSVQDTSA